MKNSTIVATETNYRKFQGLLRKGIGSRSQTEFANAAGISRGNLNRMLNGDDIARPTIAVLKKISLCMQSVTLDELLESCGYEPIDITEAIKNNMNELQIGLTNAIYEAGFKSADDVLNYINQNYIEDKSVFTVQASGENFTDCFKRAEEYAVIEQRWSIGKYICTTYFVIFYAFTKNDRLVFIGSTTDYNVIMGLEVVEPKIKERIRQVNCYTDCVTLFEEKKKMTEEERKASRFLKHILSTSGTYTETVVGCGFYYDETPDKFLEFLMDNASYFCVSKENSRLYRKAVDTGENPDEIFADFEYQGYTGTGAVIAFILSNKTEHQFIYFAKDERCEESRGCILSEYTKNKEDYIRIPSTLLQDTFFVAHALGISEFGMVYHTFTMDKHSDQVYKTKDFFYEFK